MLTRFLLFCRVETPGIHIDMIYGDPLRHEELLGVLIIEALDLIIGRSRNMNRAAGKRNEPAVGKRWTRGPVVYLMLTRSVYHRPRMKAKKTAAIRTLSGLVWGINIPTKPREHVRAREKDRLRSVPGDRYHPEVGSGAISETMKRPSVTVPVLLKANIRHRLKRSGVSSPANRIPAFAAL